MITYNIVLKDTYNLGVKMSFKHMIAYGFGVYTTEYRIKGIRF